MHLCLTQNRHDTNVSNSREMTFDEFVELFSEHIETPRKDSWMFVPWKFRVPNGGRNGENTEGTDVICLDFDDNSGWTLERAKSEFSHFTHFGYTSFNHQKNGHDRFRIVLPLKSFVTTHDIQSRRKAIINRYFGVDGSTLSISRGFYIPLCEPANMHLAQRWSNVGELFDVMTFEESKVMSYEERTREHLPSKRRYWIIEALASCGRVEDYQWRKIGLALCNLGYKFDDFVYISRSLKPSKSQIDCATKWEEISRTTNKGIQLNSFVITKFLREQGLLDVINDERDFATEEIEDFIQRVRNRKLILKPELLTKLYDEGEPELPFSREKRAKLTKKRCLLSQENIRRLNAKQMLLFAFEGYGKSYYAMLEVIRGNKVLFASLSNQQAHEQYNSFLKANPSLQCQLIVGREYSLKIKYGVEAAKQADRHPWDYGSVHIKETKARIKAKLNITDDQVEEIWAECGADKPNWVDNQVIFTTFARTQAWGKIESEASYYVTTKAEDGSRMLAIRKKTVPDDTVIFFDDPSALMFNPLKPYDEKFQHLVRPGTLEQASLEEQKPQLESEEGMPSIPFKMLEVVERNGRKYFVKPEELKFGYGLRNCRLVFTTTEAVTAWMISQQYPNIYMPKLMPEGQMKAGEIVIIKSELVRSKIDGLLMPIVNRIKNNNQFEFIGDAIGAEYNMVNSKGMNIFTETDTLIKCSLPSAHEMRPILDGLGIEGNKKNETELLAWMALDKLQQAIGRNCGYRATDRPDYCATQKAVVLCDPKLFRRFTDKKKPMMRYWVDDKNIIKDPKRFIGIEEKPDGFVQEVCWFAAYYLKYLRSGIGMRRTAFQDDYKNVTLTISNTRRPAYKRRLLTALRTVIKDQKESDPKLSNKLHNLFTEWGGDVILEPEDTENP